MRSSPPPDNTDVYLTRQGRRKVEARAEQLGTEIIPQLRRRLDAEPDDMLRAQLEAAHVELAELTRVLRQARHADQLPDDPAAVELGEHVTVRIDDGEAQHFVVVDPHEAVVGDDHHISSQSPLGRQLLGRHVGDQFDVNAPGGPYRCLVESVTR